MPRSRSPSRASDHPRPLRGRSNRSATPSPPRGRPRETAQHTTAASTTRRTHHHHHHHHHHRHHHRRSHTSSRSRSPDRQPRRRSSSRHRHRSPRAQATPPPAVLPRNARPLTKHDYDAFKALFAEYLRIQKGLSLAGLSAREAQGRFKRFVTHWNRGELAKGWYDPARREAPAAATTSAEDASSRFLESLNLHRRSGGGDGDSRDGGSGGESGARSTDDDDDDDGGDSEIIGPLPPGYDAPGVRKQRAQRATATMPTIEDLDLQKGTPSPPPPKQTIPPTKRAAEQASSARQAQHASQRESQRADLALQRERLDELCPRPEAGTRAAQLEKRKLQAEKLHSRRDRSPIMDLPDADIMGGGGGTDSFKQLKAAKERKKNERELRKEAILRQRMEEREGRLRMHREKEERTIAMLRALAESAQKGGGR
ncbi:hypothetical protein EV426DRAFT_719411 [Tirmania nivea]|nr:hypothetical protein EV426DRAFT_719411 [Tirmania nivea]